jgi:hypothetical protein
MPRRSFRSQASSKPAVHPLGRRVETVLTEAPIYSRRFSTRIELPERVCVFWTCAGKDDLSPVRNVSTGGLFLDTPQYRVVGAIAKLDFLVPEGQIRAEAVIKRVERGRGLGMKFIAVREEDRRRLAEFLRRQRHAG